MDALKPPQTEGAFYTNIYIQISLLQLQVSLHVPKGPAISTSHLTNDPHSSTGWCLDTEWLCNLVKCLFFTPTLSWVVPLGAHISKLPSRRKQSGLRNLSFFLSFFLDIVLRWTSFWTHKIMHGNMWKLSKSLHKNKSVILNQAVPIWWKKRCMC